MADRVRVLIADDSAFVRRAVERMLASVPQVEVVGNAATGEDAIRLATELRPDVIILDVNMPGMNGIAALREIMAEAPTGVLMLSTLTHEGASTTLSALELGAVDFLDKTSAGTVMDLYTLAPQLREKVLAVAGAAIPPSPAAPGAAAEPGAPGASGASGACDAPGVAHAPDAPDAPDAPGAPGERQSAAARGALPPRRERPGRPAPRGIATRCPFDVVVIGASTGGPRALAEVLSHVPADFGAGIVVAQHMPSGFTETLADRLDRRCGVAVREARDGDEVTPGLALVIPGGTHATIEREGGRLVLRTTRGTADLIHRPNINLLFRSAAASAGDRTIGVILTGMGDDGAHGLEAIREAGGRTVAESESSAVIFGMPRAAAAYAQRILPLKQIGQGIVDLCATAGRRREE